jgi:hypothetical protein
LVPSSRDQRAPQLPTAEKGAGRPRSDFGASRAGPVEVDLVGDVGVTVLLGKLACKVFNFASGERNCAPALSTQQVVAVLGCGAQPIKHLTIFCALGFGDFHVGERAQDPVYGHQPDPDAVALTEIAMELLGTTDVVAAMQQVE